MTGRVVHGTRVQLRAHVLDPQPVDQQLGELEHAGSKCRDGAREGLVARSGDGVLLADHRGARSRRAGDDVVRLERLDGAPHERERLAPVAGVPVHLPAAGLPGREDDVVPEPAEHRRGRGAGLREEGVVEARDEDRDAHERSVPADAGCRRDARAGLDDSRAGRDARGEDRDIVVGKARRERHDRLVDALHDGLGRRAGEALQQRGESLLAVQLARVAPLRDAVGPEREQVADAELRREVVELRTQVDAEQRAADARLLDVAATSAQHERRRVTGARDGHLVAVVDGAKERERRRAELARVVVPEDRLVRDLQHAARRALVARGDAHRMTRQGRQRGRSRTLAGDVADRERVAVGDRPGVVEVASDLGPDAGRPVARGDLHAGGLHQRSRQQALLQRVGDLALGLVQARVVDRERSTAGEVVRDGEVALGEPPPRLGRDERQGAERAPVRPQRGGDRRDGLDPEVVQRAHEVGRPRLDGVTDDGISVISSERAERIAAAAPVVPSMSAGRPWISARTRSAAARSMFATPTLRMRPCSSRSMLHQSARRGTARRTRSASVVVRSSDWASASLASARNESVSSRRRYSVRSKSVATAATIAPSASRTGSALIEMTPSDPSRASQDELGLRHRIARRAPAAPGPCAARPPRSSGCGRGSSRHARSRAPLVRTAPRRSARRAGAGAGAH